MTLKDDLWFLKIALEEAEKAYKLDEVPIGAVIVNDKSEIISKAHNLKEKNFNPCGHAEIIAITEAAQKQKDWRLIDCTMYVTLEPCPMCLAALVQARIKRLVFGAYDSKGGALSLNYRLHNDQKLNHQFQVLGGLEHFQCSRIISNYFKAKRTEYKFKT